MVNNLLTQISLQGEKKNKNPSKTLNISEILSMQHGWCPESQTEGPEA